MDNAQLIQKADLALSDLATAGRLSDEQSTTFIRKLINTPTILQSCRTVSMTSPTKKINKIGFGSRILHDAPVSGVALDDAKRAKPNLGQIELNTKEVLAEIHLPYDVIEDNIERGNINVGFGQSAGGLMDTILTLIAERAAVDLEELGLLGDTATVGDNYLKLFNGWLKLAAVNTGTYSSVTGLDRSVIKQAVLAMPKPYLRDRASLRQIMSVDNETELRDQLANRNTVLGDGSVQGNSPLYFFGSQVLPAAIMPSDTLLFTNPLNLIFGVQRQITLEYTKDIRTRSFIIVLTARVAFEIEEADAAVRLVATP